ncbi:hypothetical protein EOM81_12555, partial [bacterium]|nr:hypothetical protein [bacterium]
MTNAESENISEQLTPTAGDTQNQSGVKHNYPLAIEDASFKTAFSLLLKTMPYTLLRFGILVLISIVTVIWTGITLGGYAGLVNMKFDTLAMLWGFFSVGSYGGLWGLVIRYSLYMVKCGHIAVITELITKDSISNGSENMFSYGKRIVTERFKDVNVLFVIDQTVNSVIKSFNGTLDWISSLIPIPGLDKLMQLVQSIIYFAATFIDETIFSYTLARNETNPWQGAQDGLIYYCQNSKEILKTAVWAVIIDKIATALIWILFMLPG